MSGLYLPGMEMPTRCIACQLNYDSCACILTGSRFYKYNTEFDPGEERLSDCPLVPIPDHGRLVDGDKIVEGCKDKEGRYVSQFSAAIGETVEAAPTIVPADHIGDVNEMVTDKEGEG